MAESSAKRFPDNPDNPEIEMFRAHKGKLVIFLSTLFLGLFLCSSAPLLAAEGELLWSYQTGNEIWSTPAIGSDGTIYVGSDDDSLHAINPDGSRKWAFATGGQIECSPAIGSDGTIYVGSDDYKFYAINPDGTQKWAFATGGVVRRSPAIGSDGTIYVGSYDRNIHAINPDGSRKWVYYIEGIVCSSPAIGSDGTIYVGSQNNCLYAINPDGTRKWVFFTTYNILSSPAIGSDGTIYVVSNDAHLYAVNPDGTKKWAFASYWSFTSYPSSPAIGSDGTIYVGSDYKKLYAINPANGTKKWDFAARGVIRSSPAIGSDGTIYVGSDDDSLYAINSDGTRKWAFGTEGYIKSSPAIGSDGTIYVGSNDNKLYAIDTGTGEGLANSPWPKFHNNIRNTGAVASIFPSTAQDYYPAGTDFWVDIDVSDVINLFGTSFELSWDRTDYVSLVLPNPVEAGPFLGTDLVFHSNTGTQGLVSVGVSRKAGAVGVDGTGTVARVHFTSDITTPLGTEVTFSLSNVKSTDPPGDDTYLWLGEVLTVPLMGLSVWPGDADNIGPVDGADILPIGIYWKQSGTARPDATRRWYEQHCTAWDPLAATYADCDGDGIIDQADVLPIGVNWGKSHDGAGTMLASAAELPDAASAGLGEDALQTSLSVLNESERLYELTLALDPGCLNLLRGLAFKVSGASGAEIVRVELGEVWSSQALRIIQETEGTWGVGITETTESALQQAPGMALARIVFRSPENGLDQSSLGSLIVFTNLKASLTSGRIVAVKSPLELESAQEAVLPTLPKAFALYQNAPNPFNPSTTISYSVPEGKAAQVSLKVYEVRGRVVRTLVEEFREAGTYRVSWDGTDGAGRRVSSGVYFYRIRAGEFTRTRKMVLLK